MCLPFITKNNCWETPFHQVYFGIYSNIVGKFKKISQTIKEKHTGLSIFSHEKVGTNEKVGGSGRWQMFGV
jgi:hypothetical protein